MKVSLIALSISLVALVGCSASSTGEDAEATSDRLSGDESAAPSSVMDELLANQPYVGKMAMPGGSWSTVLLTIEARTSPASAGTSVIHVCADDDLDACASAEGAPAMPFTLDAASGGRWALNLRSSRSSAPVRTHYFETDGAPTVRTDLPASQLTPLVARSAWKP